MPSSRRKSNNTKEGLSYDSVCAIIVGLESFRTRSTGNNLEEVEFAHADADAFNETLREIYCNFDDNQIEIDVIKDSDASLTAMRDTLAYTISNLSAEELFIFYYAGHGFHDASGNRLSAFDTNPFNLQGTTLHLQEDILMPLNNSECNRSLIFIDACAANIRDLVQGRDVINDLHLQEIEEFLESAQYCGMFLSCSPGERSYSSPRLGHGVWTNYLLQALRGEAEEALTRERWLTDSGLRDWLYKEVPNFITKETSISASQTPRAIVSSSSTFHIRYVPAEPEIPPNAILSNIVLKYSDAYLESVETGPIRSLDGFQPGFHTVPDRLSDSADAWVCRLLEEDIAEEIQKTYSDAKDALKFRRRESSRESNVEGGSIDTPVFRYMVEARQNPDDASEFAICRSLILRQGWQAKREEISDLFGHEFDCLVIEIEDGDVRFDEVVDKLEDVEQRSGGRLEEDDRKKRAEYVSEDGAEFVIDLKKRRFEIIIPGTKCIDLVEAVQKYQFGLTGDPNPMLPLSQRSVKDKTLKKRSKATKRRKIKRKDGGTMSKFR